MGKVVFLFEKDKKPRRKGKPGQIHASEIANIIKRKFNITWWKFWYNWRIYIADEWYYPIGIKALDLIKPTSQYKYREEIFDCDDFSFLKKGYEEEYGNSVNMNLAFGIIWVYSPTKFYGHALNFFIDPEYRFWFYEPQNDSFFEKVRDNWELMLAVV